MAVKAIQKNFQKQDVAEEPEDGRQQSAHEKGEGGAEDDDKSGSFWPAQ